MVQRPGALLLARSTSDTGESGRRRVIRPEQLWLINLVNFHKRDFRINGLTEGTEDGGRFPAAHDSVNQETPSRASQTRASFQSRITLCA
jgi:hypothetical protein